MMAVLPKKRSIPARTYETVSAHSYKYGFGKLQYLKMSDFITWRDMTLYNLLHDIDIKTIALWNIWRRVLLSYCFLSDYLNTKPAVFQWLSYIVTKVIYMPMRVRDKLMIKCPDISSTNTKYIFHTFKASQLLIQILLLNKISQHSTRSLQYGTEILFQLFFPCSEKYIVVDLYMIRLLKKKSTAAF